jgi:hypothetical protein
MVDGYQAPVSTTWTTATAANTASTFTTSGYDTVIVTLVASAALASGVVNFEVYDGAAWLPVKAASIIDYTTTGTTIAPPASSSKGYQIPVAGFPQFRVRLSAVLTAGTLTVVGIVSSAPDTSVLTVGLDPSQPLPAGSNVIGSVTQPDGASVTLGATADTAYGGTGSASVVAALKGIYAATLAPLAAGTNVIGLTTPAYIAPGSWPGTTKDMRSYGSVTITVLTAPSAAYTPQWSPDNTNWFAMSGVDLNFNTLITISTTFTGAVTLKGGGYVRLNGGTGGTFMISGGQ